MKTLRLIGKLGMIVIGVFSFSLITSSCKKDRDCKCTYSYTGQADVTVIVTTKEKCWELDQTVEFQGQQLLKVECEKD